MTAEEFIKNEITYETRQKLIGTFSRAYADTSNLKISDLAFTSEKGKETLVLVRNLKVEEQIKAEIDNKFLPFKYKECKNYADNCTHYEFETENSIITVSRVKRENQMPRRAIYRENLSFNNQMSWFEEEEEKNEKKHILLTHVCEDDKLKSLMLGIPSSDGKTWECNFNLLKELNVMTNTEEELPAGTLKIRKNIKEGNI